MKKLNEYEERLFNMEKKRKKSPLLPHFWEGGLPKGCLHVSNHGDKGAQSGNRLPQDVAVTNPVPFLWPICLPVDQKLEFKPTLTDMQQLMPLFHHTKSDKRFYRRLNP